MSLQAKLQIDYREKSLINLLQHLPLESVNLDCGDIVLKTDENIQILIERKSVSDLVSSIKDGRYSEQKKRLCCNYSRNRIVYLIEGSIKNDSEKSKVWSSILHTIFRDNLIVFRTSGLNESASFISELWERFSTKNTDWLGFLDGNSVSYAITTDSKISTKKKENNSAEATYLNMLSQITGVSIKIAKEISQVYPTMKELINGLEISGIGSLADIKIGNRKIGKVCAQRIYDCLVQQI